VAVEYISPNPHQPRTTFEKDALQDLAGSIKEHGVLQPLILARAAEEGRYHLIAGERRWQAAKLAGLAQVPAIVREATDQEMLLLALIENVQRADLNPLETAEAYRELANQFNLTHEQIAAKVGKSRPSVSNTLKLLEAPPDVLQALLDGVISEGHARALQGLPAQTQNAAVRSVQTYHFSVRQTEELARNLRDLPEHEQVRAVRDVIQRMLFLESGEGDQPARKKPAKSTPAPTERSPELDDLEEQLTAAMAFKTTIKQSGRGGTITIHYYNPEDLNTLTDKLLGDD
jgi:ParB family chromosome partitioning protein